MADPVLLDERDGAVAVLTLNRPEARNALNGELIEGLGSALARADADPSVRVIVLTGTGDRAFCAGMDLKSRPGGAGGPGGGGQPGDGAAAFGRFHDEGLATPLIAAVNGYAVGGGLDLMLACDLVVA